MYFSASSLSFSEYLLPNKSYSLLAMVNILSKRASFSALCLFLVSAAFLALSDYLCFLSSASFCLVISSPNRLMFLFIFLLSYLHDIPDYMTHHCITIYFSELWFTLYIEPQSSIFRRIREIKA